MKTLYYSSAIDLERYPLPTLELADLGYRLVLLPENVEYHGPEICIWYPNYDVKEPPILAIAVPNKIMPLAEWIDTLQKLKFLETL